MNEAQMQRTQSCTTPNPTLKINWFCLCQIINQKQIIFYTVPRKEWREQIAKRMAGKFTEQEFTDAWQHLKLSGLVG